MTAEEFYRRFVALSPEQAATIEQTTRLQSECAVWFRQRRVHITSTMVKDIVCHRKVNVESLVRRKLMPSYTGNRATRYGQEHEAEALAEYVAFKQQSDRAAL